MLMGKIIALFIGFIGVLLEAWMDGECWIMVPKWATDKRTLEIRGHELGHCEKGAWHK